MSCITDEGYVAGEKKRLDAQQEVAIIKAIELGIIAAVNAADMIDNYRKQRDIQDRGLALAEEAQAQLQGTFWPRELQFLAEFANPEEIEAVETMGRRYAGRLVSTIAGGFAAKRREAKCSMPRHCTSANMKTLQDIYAAEAFAMANARTLGRNIAFAEYQARDDKNWDRRTQAVALGRKLLGEAASLMRSALGGLASDAGNIAQSVNSALQGIGYALNRDMTLAPLKIGMEGREQVGPPTEAQSKAAMTEQASSMSSYLSQDVAAQTSLPYNLAVTSDSGKAVQNDLTVDAMNQGQPDGMDLARVGKQRFNVRNGFGYVEVDMAQFAFGRVDEFKPGDKGDPKA
jgi:hypothetical protein